MNKQVAENFIKSNPKFEIPCGMQSAGSNRRFCGAKRTRCGASGLNL